MGQTSEVTVSALTVGLVADRPVCIALFWGEKIVDRDHQRVQMQDACAGIRGEARICGEGLSRRLSHSRTTFIRMLLMSANGTALGGKREERGALAIDRVGFKIVLFALFAHLQRGSALCTVRSRPRSRPCYPTACDGSYRKTDHAHQEARTHSSHEKSLMINFTEVHF